MFFLIYYCYEMGLGTAGKLKMLILLRCREFWICLKWQAFLSVSMNLESLTNFVVMHSWLITQSLFFFFSIFVFPPFDGVLVELKINLYREDRYDTDWIEMEMLVHQLCLLIIISNFEFHKLATNQRYKRWYLAFNWKRWYLPLIEFTK